ncbi:trypsin-like peptidase domain-containing protein [Roseburia sp. BX1005]|uniref:Trypsin-like peptidase domain-containing protein n=1 Tax=Roseburia zhanii TaxID=2763064 RepID=A0A923RSW8_9FIRM|nr:trypsin-like peptidase domain-containing protein [Roseburia zhanii]MBC5714111.1 trypsin-like peptidase domain-containing protein [Roseburia zhanii]OLA84191.1 MAG: hypothetical protein BHW44_10160 [Roseburia sp. 40_7]
MSKKSFFKKMTKCAALALVFGVVGGTAFSGASYFIGQQFPKSTQTESSDTAVTKIQPTSTAASVSSSDISDVVDEVMPSIVAITSMTQQEVQSFFGQGQIVENESSGSGILVNKDDNYLYVATNNHVVEGSTALTVQFSDGTTASATVRGTDPSDDLSVVQVALSDLSEDTLNTIKIATIGDSDQLAVGEAAIAIGNALGYGQSVTTGVISALGREVTIQDETTGESISNSLIQTDAAINPGNSGGALLNVKGEVIGINSSKYSDTSVEGMGFAIPMATAKPILEDLIANGKTTTTGSPYLGIYGVDVTEDVSKQYNMPEGVYVAQIVDGSGAANAGITTGSIITKVDDTEVGSMEELKECINKYKVGDTVTVTVQIADGGSYTEKQISVTLTNKTY